jgi:TRAP-type mannitol/chloroaromatic compound transport system substrate-binding protein
MELLNEFYKKYNIHSSYRAATLALRWAAGTARKSSRLQDIKGLKLRIGGFAGKVIERMGGVPQNIPGGEIYTALEKGTIDAAEWVGPYDDLKLGFNKVAPFYYYPGWWEGGPAAGRLHQYGEMG